MCLKERFNKLEDTQIKDVNILLLKYIPKKRGISRVEKIISLLSKKYGYTFTVVDKNKLLKLFVKESVECDVILARSPFYFTWGWLISRLKRKPLVFDFRDPYLEIHTKLKTRIKDYFGLIFKNRSNIVFSSMKHYIYEYSLDRRKVIYAPNAAPKEWTYITPRKEELAIIYVGQLTQKYRLDLAIKAVSILKKFYPDIKLYVAGSGGEKQKLQLLASRLKVRDNIIFVGRIPYNEVPNVINKCMFGIAFNNWMGQKEFEYLALGKPAIVLDGRRRSEKIDAFVLVKPDPKDIALKISNLIEDKRLRRKLGNIGRQLVRDFFNWDNIANIWHKAIEGLLT